MARAKMAVAVVLLVVSLAARAEEPTFDLDIPPRPAAEVLTELTRQAGLQPLVAAELVAGVASPGVKGRLTLREAVARALAGTGLAFEFTGPATVAITKAPPPLKATAAPAPQKAELEEVAVTEEKERSYAVAAATTATKTDTPLMETPVAVQVVPQQVLQDQAVTTLAEALVNVSGVQVRPDGANGYGEYLTLRGFTTSDSAGNLLVDGLQFANVNGVTQLSNVEEVEVLRGPAAILYGRMEPGGVVNVKTKRPREAPLRAVSQSLGSWGTSHTTLDLGGPLDDAARVLFRFNASYDDVGSWRQFLYSKGVQVAPSFLWRARPGTEVSVDVVHSSYRYGEDNWTFPWVDGRPGPISWKVNLGEPSPSRTNGDSIGLAIQHRLAEGWTASYRGNLARQTYVVSATQILDIFLDPSNALKADRALFLADQTRQSFFNGIDVVGHFTTGPARHTLLLGVDHTASDGELTTGGSDFGAPSTIDVLNPVHPGAPALVADPAAGFAGKSSGVQSGAYMQDQLELPFGLFATAGLRWQSFDFSSTAAPPGGAQSLFSRKEAHLTPRAGLLWRPVAWLSSYASYTEGFGAGSGTIFPDKPMPPTGAKQLEGGLKTEMLGGRLRGSAALFDLRKTNIPGSDPVNGPRFAVPIGEVRSRGAEVDLQGEPVPGLGVVGSFAHTDVRLSKASFPFQVVGERQNGVPLNSASLWATYELRQGALTGLKGGAGWQWRDRAGPNTPAYSLVSAMLGYTARVQGQRWTAQVNVSNLLDKAYWDNAQAFGQVAFLDFGNPRSVTGTLRAEF